MKKTPGFTLIELLVVIAILGILVAIVLASLNASRQRSRIASLKATVTQIKNEAEIFYSTHNSYIALGSSVCDQMPIFLDEVTDLISNQPYPFGMCVVTQSGQDYAVEVSLGDNTYWCADSEGYIGESAPEPTPLSGNWSTLRLCDGSGVCGNHSRTICAPLN